MTTGPRPLSSPASRKRAQPPRGVSKASLPSLLCLLGLLLALPGCKGRAAGIAAAREQAAGVTTISIGETPLRTGLKRFGINLSGQTFYDSGQMLRDLTQRNPGFEAETWQSILRCRQATATTCVDENRYAVWPDNFLKGAHFEFLSGPARGLSGTVASSLKSGAAAPDLGVSFSFDRLDRAPQPGDFVVLRMSLPGDPAKGWWTDSMGTGSTFTPDTDDLSPDTPGKQALRISAAAPGQSAQLHSYFDTFKDRSFIQLNGEYHLTFRAKGDGGGNSLEVGISRLATAHGNEVLLPRTTVHLTPQWKNYDLTFNAHEDGSEVGTVDLDLLVSGATVLLDDMTITAPAGANNPTAFRDAVVDTLRSLHPGILRYTDTGVATGSTIDNMIAPPDARVRAGYSTQETSQDGIPLGLPEFLRLCATIGAEPWYSLPASVAPEEAAHLVEYLGGPSASPFGARRAHAGQAAPWTTVFPVIHLEYGNELWNKDTFYGAVIADPTVYGQRASEIFSAMHAAPGFAPGKFDLILGSLAINSDWTRQELTSASVYDSIAVAPYLFYQLNDTSTDEALFGPMFAEPESIDSRPTGYMAQQRKAVASAPHPAKLSVYEVNLSTDSGSAPQAAVNAVVPSIGAGITLADHLLLMARDLGITTASTFSLPQYANRFHNPKDPTEMTPLWGMVVDMGGPTNLRRPQFLAEQLVNAAILPNLLTTTLSGANPTWDQPKSQNNDIQLDGAHFLEVFAFAEGTHRSAIVFNLERDRSLPIAFSGAGAPTGQVTVSQLTATHITDTNEQTATVRPQTTQRIVATRSDPWTLPPFSMTVLQWKTAP